MTFPYIPSGSRIGPFELQSQLSEAEDGNMSRLFGAIHTAQAGRPVVIKIARSDNPTYTNFIRDEVAQLMNMRHPNVVHLYPIQLAANKKVYIARGVEIRQHFNNTPPYYYAMEYIPGGSLLTHEKRILQFPMGWRIELLYQIGMGIKYLHDLGIAHRDIKPANIIFRSKPNPNKRPEPVLVDFGIASRHNENPNAFAATAQYASPEVIERLSGMRANYRTTINREIDHALADIWSFGVLAYEIIKGQHPLAPFNNDEQLVERILHTPPNSMDDIDPQIQRLILGDPQNADTHSVGFKDGMISKVRDNRPNIEQVLQYLDTETSYLPPRY